MSDEEQAPHAPLAEGEILAGKYQVERILGKGGMGVVVAAMHLHLKQRVAIKFLLPSADADTVKRFAREARAAFKLRSEHVARVLDVGELPSGAPFMVMEHLDGSDLSRVSRKRGQLPFEDAVDYVLQACEAIGEAHTLGIVHRDLKPANLFLITAADGSPTVKVLDFGISKDRSEVAGEEDLALTNTSAVLGSPYYMAPEQMRSTRSADARSDIWSIGVILYQLVTKAVPFKAPSFVELAMMVVTDEPPPPSTKRADIPPGLEAAILRCLRKDPAERFANVAELAAAIAPFGGPSAARSAAWIARTQGAPVPVLERPSALNVAPPPATTGPSAIGSLITSGPSLPNAPPSVPPAGVESSVVKEAAPAATGAAWVGVASGSVTPLARRAGTRALVVGLAAAALAVLGALAALRAVGGADPKRAPAAATAETPTASTVAAAGVTTRIVEVEVATTASAAVPASASASASSSATPAPRVTPGPVAKPAAAAAPTPSPTAKKNVLDIDIK